MGWMTDETRNIPWFDPMLHVFFLDNIVRCWIGMKCHVHLYTFIYIYIHLYTFIADWNSCCFQPPKHPKSKVSQPCLVPPLAREEWRKVRSWWQMPIAKFSIWRRRDDFGRVNCKTGDCDIWIAGAYHLRSFFVQVGNMVVSWNRDTCKSSILLGGSIVNHPF